MSKAYKVFYASLIIWDVFKYNTRNMCVATRFRLMFQTACKGHKPNDD